MKINAGKTKLITYLYLVIGTSQKIRGLSPVTLHVEAARTAESERAKNLGVVFDRHLSFESYVDELVNRNGLLLGLPSRQA